MIKDIRGLIYGFLTLDEKIKIRGINDFMLDKQIMEELIKTRSGELEMEIVEDGSDIFHIIFRINENIKIKIYSPEQARIEDWKRFKEDIEKGRKSELIFDTECCNCILKSSMENFSFRVTAYCDTRSIKVNVDGGKICDMIERIMARLEKTIYKKNEKIIL